MKVLGLIESPNGKLNDIVITGACQSISKINPYIFLTPDTSIKKYDEMKYVKGEKWENCEIKQLTGIWGLSDFESNFICIEDIDENEETENRLLNELKKILDRKGLSYMDLTNDVFSLDYPCAIPKSKYDHFKRWQAYRKTKSEGSIYI